MPYQRSSRDGPEGRCTCCDDSSENQALNNTQHGYPNEGNNPQFEHGSAISCSAGYRRDSGNNGGTGRGRWVATDGIVTCGLGCEGVVSSSLRREGGGGNWRILDQGF